MPINTGIFGLFAAFTQASFHVLNLLAARCIAPFAAPVDEAKLKIGLLAPDDAGPPPKDMFANGFGGFAFGFSAAAALLADVAFAILLDCEATGFGAAADMGGCGAGSGGAEVAFFSPADGEDVIGFGATVDMGG